jgi:hypothetical protein
MICIYNQLLFAIMTKIRLYSKQFKTKELCYYETKTRSFMVQVEQSAVLLPGHLHEKEQAFSLPDGGSNP